MPTSISSADLLQTIAAAQAAAARGQTKNITVNGNQVAVRYPFPSPGDWRGCCIYFLMLDRFANATAAPRGTWNQIYKLRQGGTFKGVEAQLGYIADLGTKAIWLSPVLKNVKPDGDYNYHGYGAQDFLNVDERFASDGTRETAELELAELVEQAHARGLYVIFDIVLNHAGRVFDYVRPDGVVQKFSDAAVMNGPRSRVIWPFLMLTDVLPWPESTLTNCWCVTRLTVTQIVANCGLDTAECTVLYTKLLTELAICELN